MFSNDEEVRVICIAISKANEVIIGQALVLKELLVNQSIITKETTYSELKDGKSLFRVRGILMEYLAFGLSQEMKEGDYVSDFDLYINVKTDRDYERFPVAEWKNLQRRRRNLYYRLNRLRTHIFMNMELKDTPEETKKLTEKMNKEELVTSVARRLSECSPIKDKEGNEEVNTEETSDSNEEEDLDEVENSDETKAPTQTQHQYSSFRSSTLGRHIEGDRDLYETPITCTLTLLNVIENLLRSDMVIFEPCSGNGKICEALCMRGFTHIIARDKYAELDIERYDYLDDSVQVPEYDFLITNPPFNLKKEFLAKAFASDKPFAMLLPLGILTTLHSGPLLSEKGFGLVIQYPAPRFLKNGKDTVVGPVGWIIGNVQSTEKGTFNGVIISAEKNGEGNASEESAF